MSSLIPSRQFAFSPGLAATIGLEEAILLQCLSEQSESIPEQNQSNFSWYQLKQTELSTQLPFWSANEIGRIAENLRQKGIILLASPPLHECGYIRFAFNESIANKTMTSQNLERTQNSITESLSRHTNNPAQAWPITKQWLPNEACFQMLSQHGVPENFVRDQIVEFVQYWSERGDARHSWDNRFVSYVLRYWRDYESRQNQQKREPDIPSWAQSTTQANRSQPIDRHWKPSTDALEILEIQAGIHRNFIEDAVPEFVVYWSEKGEHSNTWNARFINHVKRQWAGYQHAVKNDLEPRPIEPNWQPSSDVYDVLRFARIEIDFAKSLLPEFVIYWRDRNEARPSWNTIFLQFVKKQWLRQTTDNNYKGTRDRTIAEDLTDRSWAS